MKLGVLYNTSIHTIEAIVECTHFVGCNAQIPDVLSTKSGSIADTVPQYKNSGIRPTYQ
jgi:hypothetical protein